MNGRRFANRCGESARTMPPALCVMESAGASVMTPASLAVEMASRYC